ncbi:MAG: acyl-CoA thioesterase [Muribaculum sp.]|nr:acyl-CoA thioesterase [Muribaculum sp.]
MSNNPRVPVPERPFRHSVAVQTRFNDADMFGHINNSVFMQFFDLGKVNYFEAALGKDFMKSGLSIVIVNINCNFVSPAFLEEPLTVLTQTVHIGEKSIALDQRIINTETGDVKCTAHTILAGYDIKTLKSIEIPDFAKTALTNYENAAID